MRFGTITEAPCINVAPAADDRCNDPAFALLNPDICPVGQKLVVKPAIAISCHLGSTQFRAFLITNGQETDVTDSSIFTSSDSGVALIGVKSGNATGLAPGQAQITATYQGQTAHAELNVMGCTGPNCDSTVAMLLLIDNSRSMSQAFSGSYSTKLVYAKAASQAFANSINQAKDFVGAMWFNADTVQLLDAPTHDAAQVSTDIAGISQTQQLTTFRDALDAAIAELNATSADLKVLVLVSDGEDTTTDYTSDNNPLIPADNFKAAGGVIMALGIRAHDKGFNFLEALVTGGFFINAYGATQDAAIAYLKGLKGYICAGNCTPAGDEIVYQGVSNYTGFANWDVIQGEVDLLGNGFYDVLPGNGLYVDLRGSGDLNGNYDIPILKTKNVISLKASHVYRVAIDLAGNQVVDRPTDTVSLQVFSDSITLLSQQIAMPDYTQGWHPYSYSFTAPADMDVNIEISQTNNTGNQLSGVLLGRMKVDDTTDIINILNDSFDTENPHYIPPRCGIASVFYGGGYAVGYNCYGDGCLDTPPPTQLSDPSPLPDIESGFTPPTIYTSTKTACASCPSGSANQGSTSLIPAMTGANTPSGVVSAKDEQSGFEDWKAFDGNDNTYWHANSAVPSWLQYQFAAAQTASIYAIKFASSGSAEANFTLSGSNDGSTWTLLDTRTGLHFYTSEKKRFPITTPGSYLYYRLDLTSVPATDTAEISSFELFSSVASQICSTATATSDVSQSAADSAAYAQALAAATAQLNCVPVFTSTQQFTSCCAYHTFCVTKSATATSFNSQDEADAAATAAAKVLADAALDCTQSNNNQQITLIDDGAGSPYPSVKYVSGLTGVITKVTVAVNGITHFFSDDIILVLVSPNGATVVLMANCGHAPLSGINLVLDDAAGSSMPSTGSISSSTYKPTTHGSFPPLEAPGPQPTYGTTLAALNGGNPNGQWALFAMDSYAGFSGSIANWDLTITSS